MSRPGQRLRDAAAAERQEWADETGRPVYPHASRIHLALADWLDDLADRVEAHVTPLMGPDAQHGLVLADLIFGVEVQP